MLNRLNSAAFTGTGRVAHSMGHWPNPPALTNRWVESTVGPFPHGPARYPLNLLRRKELCYADADAGFPVSMMLSMLC